MSRGWKSLPLSDAHAAELQGAGIKFEVARARGYRTVERTERFDLREAFGFTGKQTGATAFPGLLVPMYAPGEPSPTHVQLKVAARRERGDGKDGPKYETPVGAGNRLDVHPSRHGDLGDPSQRKWITEGAKKADALTSHGELAISITGVWNWRGKNSSGGRLELGDFERIVWNGSEVYVCFDSDALANGNVRSAMDRLVHLCRSRGARTQYVVVPGKPEDKVGADDFLAAGGSVAALIAAAVTRLPEDVESDVVVLQVLERLLRLAPGRVVYVASWAKFLRFDRRDGVWKIDYPGPGAKIGMHATSVALEAIEELVADGVLGASKRLDDTLAQRAIRRALNMPGTGFVVNVDELDANPFLLNCTNGVVDVRSGNLLPHDPGYLMTKTTGVAFPGLRHTNDDVELMLTCVPIDVQPWWKRYIGSGAVGLLHDEVFLVLRGMGANGKSTMLEAFPRATLGGYAGPVPPKMFTSHTEHPTMEASLFGMRLAWGSETSDRSVLDMEVIKRLTGGEAIRARRLYEDYWDVPPTWTLLLSTNYRPIVLRSDHGTWRRLVLLDLPYVFVNPTDRPPDASRPHEKAGSVGLRHRLKDVRDNREAVLSWIVEGAVDYLRHGLGALPKTVADASHSWRMEEDTMAVFFDERLVADTGSRLLASDVSAEFEEFMIESGFSGGGHGGIWHPQAVRRALSAVLEALCGTPLTTSKGAKGVRYWDGIAWASTRGKATT